MKPIRRPKLFTALAAATTLLAAVTPLPADAPPPPSVQRMKPIDGVRMLYDIPYVPADVLTGNPSARKDHQFTLDVYIPEGIEGSAPCVIAVHGGGYGSGDKAQGVYRDYLIHCLERGMIGVSINYPLAPKGIFPSVFDTTRDAVRFLRMNHERFQIDPTRIGAFGISAGGWLLSSSYWTHQRTIAEPNTTGKTTRVDKFLENPGRYFRYDPRHDPPPLRFAMGHDRSHYPEVNGSLQAIALDFDRRNLAEMLGEFAEFSAVQKWSAEHEPPIDKDLAAKGVHYERARVVGARNQPHVPKPDHAALDPDGIERPMGELLADFMQRALGDDARTPIAEVHPGSPFFAESAEVSFVTADPSITVHYTTDGSTPTTDSPVYDKPFTIEADTQVKAVAVTPGRRPSLVTQGWYYHRPERIAPTIQQTDRRLPKAKVGEPYEFQFTTDLPVDQVWWIGAGELRITTEWQRLDPIDPTGLRLDRDTGVLHGTPTSGGTFWVQVQAGNKQGLATYRDYVLEIEGPRAGSDDAPAPEDTYQPFATLSPNDTKFAERLCSTALRDRGMVVVMQTTDVGILLLCPAVDRPRAIKLLNNLKDLAREPDAIELIDP